MSKYTYAIDYLYKYPSEIFGFSFDFDNDLATNETLSSCTASVYDTDGTEVSSTMVDSIVIGTTSITVTIKAGTSGQTYEIKLAGVSSASNIFVHYIKCEVVGSVTLNSKLGDINANSYVNLEQANNYIRNKYNHANAWDLLTIEGKKRVLIQAAREIDRLRIYGDPYYDSQSMKFPRDDHDVITGNCATPLNTTYFKHSNLYSTTYGTYPQNYWKYGSVHITSGTPINETSLIASSNVTTGVISFEALTASPTTNTQFIVFAPIYQEVRDAQCEQALYLAENSGMEALSEYRSLGANYIKIGDAIVQFSDNSMTTTAVSPKAKKLLSRYIQKSLIVQRG